MLAGIILLGLFGICFLIYGLTKIKSIYKVLFLIKNENKINENIRRINDEIRKTTDLKEKNKLLKELKKIYKLFHITDGEVGGQILAKKPSAPIEYTVDVNLLSQLNFAIGILTTGFIILLIGILLAIIGIRLSPDYYIYWW
jgi:hypothetical protein